MGPKSEEAGYVEIEKKFKGKLLLTVCRLTFHRPARASDAARVRSNHSLTRRSLNHTGSLFTAETQRSLR